MMKKKAAKQKRGRPRKTSGKLGLRFQIAIDEKRKGRYRDCAERQGVDLAEWIRRVCDAAADAQLGDT